MIELTRQNWQKEIDGLELDDLAREKLKKAVSAYFDGSVLPYTQGLCFWPKDFPKWARLIKIKEEGDECLILRADKDNQELWLEEINIPASGAFDSRLISLRNFAGDLIKILQVVFSYNLESRSIEGLVLDDVTFASNIIKIRGMNLSDAIDKVHRGEMNEKDFFIEFDKEIYEHEIRIIEDLKRQLEVLRNTYTGERQIECSRERAEEIMEAGNFRFPSLIGKLFGVKVISVTENIQKDKMIFTVSGYDENYDENIKRMRKALQGEVVDKDVDRKRKNKKKGG